MDISLEVFQISNGMAAVSGRLVIVQYDRSLVVISDPLQPHVRFVLWLFTVSF